MAVGAAGFAVASAATLIGPVALLLQGQAWRWSWITAFSAIMLIVPTALAMYRDRTLGWPAALLLISAWTFTPLWGCLCLAALLLCCIPRIREATSVGAVLRVCAPLATFAICAWNLKTRSSSVALLGHSLTDWVTARHQLFAVQLLLLLASAAVFFWICRPRSARSLVLVQAVLFLGLVHWLPSSLIDLNRDGTPYARAVFADWRNIIAPDQTVFIAPAHNSPSFAWFTLERPSYLTVDQSSGVVFSRAAALEVRRRSEVLRPVMSPDWQLLSNFGKPASATGATGALALHPSTLDLICGDPLLDFVVAQGDIGVEPLRQVDREPWRGWNLYSCVARRSRPAALSSDPA